MGGRGASAPAGAAGAGAGGPEVLRGKGEARGWARAARAAGGRVALVPTMGCLHAGHLALVEVAAALADRVVVSIYLNPAQFAPGEDFGSSPRRAAADLEALSRQGLCDAVFLPSEGLYEDVLEAEREASGAEAGAGTEREPGARELNQTWVTVERLQQGLCGGSRPTFFRGVATTVCKLFNLLDPHVAVFGEKDWQQLAVIRRMVRDLDFDVEIVGAAVVREGDGLALSSRNLRLSPRDRASAPALHAALQAARVRVQGGERLVGPLVEEVRAAVVGAGAEVDYVECVNKDSLQRIEVLEAPEEALLALAAHYGSVRLIDNISLSLSIDEDPNVSSF